MPSIGSMMDASQSEPQLLFWGVSTVACTITVVGIEMFVEPQASALSDVKLNPRALLEESKRRTRRWWGSAQNADGSTGEIGRAELIREVD